MLEAKLTPSRPRRAPSRRAQPSSTRKRKAAGRGKLCADSIVISEKIPARAASLGIDFATVLRQAGLAESFGSKHPVRVTTEEFFALWNVIEANGARPDFGTRVGTHTSSD